MVAASSIGFVRHEGDIRKAGTAPSLRHPAHPCNTLTCASAQELARDPTEPDLQPERISQQIVGPRLPSRPVTPQPLDHVSIEAQISGHLWPVLHRRSPTPRLRELRLPLWRGQVRRVVRVAPGGVYRGIVPV